MQKREAKHQIYFNHWLKNVYKKSLVYEIKQTTTNSLLFSAVVDHQIEALLAVRHGSFVFKIPDCGFQNPFDGFCFNEEPAYVVIFYPDFFCLIGIDTFLLEKERSKRKSLTADRAKEISTVTVKTTKRSRAKH